MLYITVTDKNGGRFSHRVNTKEQAIEFLNHQKNKQARSVDIFAEPFHSTTDQKALVAFYGNGSYWDSMGKSYPHINAKRVK
jgi:hypothetical protein